MTRDRRVNGPRALLRLVTVGLSCYQSAWWCGFCLATDVESLL